MHITSHLLKHAGLPPLAVVTHGASLSAGSGTGAGMPDFLLPFACAAASLRRQPEVLMASFSAGPKAPGLTLLKWLP